MEFYWIMLILAFILALGGGVSFGGGGILIPGYSMKKGYDYICSDCGMLISKNYYHSYKECQLREGKLKHPDHRVYYGAKPYIKTPSWHNTLKEQRQ